MRLTALRHEGDIRSQERLTPYRRPTRPRATNDDRQNEPPPNNDILERIAKAKAYKAQRKIKSNPPPPSLGSSSQRPEPLKYNDPPLSEEASSASFDKTADEGAQSFQEPPEVENISGDAPLDGSTDRPASFSLNDDVDMDVIRPEPRPFDSLPEKTKHQKQDVPDVASDDKSYKPKVSAWGVFPRPANISEAYGGGRIIHPNERILSKEEEEKRKKENAAMVRDFRRRQGLEVDSEAEAAFQEVFDEANELMNQGRLLVAAEKFKKASQLVEFRSRLAGNALYRHAVCLDSVGRYDEAKILYEALTRHPRSEVSKLAKNMLFGFEAMEFLKVDKTDVIKLKDDYAEYFKRIPQNWSTGHVAPPETDRPGGELVESGAFAILLSTAILLLPLMLVLSLSFSK